MKSLNMTWLLSRDIARLRIPKGEKEVQLTPEVFQKLTTAFDAIPARNDIGGEAKNYIDYFILSLNATTKYGGVSKEAREQLIDSYSKVIEFLGFKAAEYLIATADKMQGKEASQLKRLARYVLRNTNRAAARARRGAWFKGMVGTGRWRIYRMLLLNVAVVATIGSMIAISAVAIKQGALTDVRVAAPATVANVAIAGGFYALALRLAKAMADATSNA